MLTTVALLTTVGVGVLELVNFVISKVERLRDNKRSEELHQEIVRHLRQQTIILEKMLYYQNLKDK